MPNLFESEIETVHVSCSSCGTPLELAASAIGLFGSHDSVLCMDCVLREGNSPTADASVTLTERIRLIDETVDEFASHLRNVLVRCIKPDLTWNREYGIDDWSDPTDMIAAAYAPSVWYAFRKHLAVRESPSGEN
jgi:hypothetical protein